MKNTKRLILLISICFFHWSGSLKRHSFDEQVKSFVTGFNALQIPDFDYDFHTYFNTIPTITKLEEQEKFFVSQKAVFKSIKRQKLNRNQQTAYDHIWFEIEYNLTRIQLELNWVNNGRTIPQTSIYELKNRSAWYSFFITRYTSTNYTPEEVYNLGLSEVEKVKKEILNIRTKLNFKDSLSFYTHLKSEQFILTNKQSIINGFTAIDSIARTHLPKLFGNIHVPAIYAMEWPDANAYTPPGMYLNRSSNPYGKDVFQFNYHNGRYNRRAMEWLYMHEAIPGHHLQFSLRKMDSYGLQQLNFYPGNFEGWACYIEYFGKEIGLYQDPYSELGKWEWDLVRSARLVLDVGIHYYGWSKKEALDYWKKTIPGQDDIAEREVTRVTNWCGQTLSYKVGANELFRIKKKWKEKFGETNEAKFHTQFLETGTLPFSVLENRLLLN